MHNASEVRTADQSAPRRPYALKGHGASERTLFRRYAAGDLRAREELVERYLPLAHRLTARYRFTSEPTDDLQQVAALALLKAVDRYRPEIGPFVTYAIPMIQGELKRHFRDRGWTVRVGRSVQQHFITVQQATEELAASLGHTPTARELAEATGLTLEEVLEALEAHNAYQPLALDAPGSTGADVDDASPLLENIGHEDDRYNIIELTDLIGDTARALPPRERAVLYLRFVDDLTQKEIGERIGVSQMQVSRLLRCSLDRLRCTASAAA